MTVIEVRPFRNGWQEFEGFGVQPVFLDPGAGNRYEKDRACFRAGEIRVFDSNRATVRLIPFSETDRKL